MFNVYGNIDLSGKFFDCLVTAMAKVQSVDRKEFFFCLLAM